jgi:hypothetical protein
VHHGHARETARVGQEKPRGEIVGGVDDGVDAADERSGRRGQRPPADHLDRKARSTREERALGRVGLARPDVGVGEQELPVQVLDLHRVLVGEYQRADARLGERDGRGRADAARPDDEHAKRSERAIRRSTHRG